MRPHVPVLLDRLIETLGDIAGKTIIDTTFGAGGYSRRFLELGASVIAFDRDPTVRKFSDILLGEYPGVFQFINAPFSTMSSRLNNIISLPYRADQGLNIDAIIFDLGISSMQIDSPERGFSWRFDAPLDMRMGNGISAADMIKDMSVAELAKILREYGDVRKSGVIAAVIKQQMPQTTFALRDLIHNPKDIAPVFQALRIAVNDEIGELEHALKVAPYLLGPDGIIGTVTFHSLEDRIVKNKFRDLTRLLGDPKIPDPAEQIPHFALLKTYRPDHLELAMNPRARSAHLRAIARR